MFENLSLAGLLKINLDRLSPIIELATMLNAVHIGINFNHFQRDNLLIYFNTTTFLLIQILVTLYDDRSYHYLKIIGYIYIKGIFKS